MACKRLLGVFFFGNWLNPIFLIVSLFVCDFLQQPAQELNGKMLDR